MVSGGPPIFSESEAIFTASVIERDKVKKGGVVERDGRSASGKNIGTVVENGVGMGILVAWYCWPVVAFECREVDPALTRARKVISLSQQAD